MWNQTSKKFMGGFLAIITLSLATLYITQTYFSPERQAERRLADLERRYAEDTYGGKTPEETLELFINALKAGDIELASKYFVLDKQEEWLENLRVVKNKNFLQEMIGDLQRPREKKSTNKNQATFYIYNDNKQLAIAINVARGPNGIWKIVDM